MYRKIYSHANSIRVMMIAPAFVARQGYSKMNRLARNTPELNPKLNNPVWVEDHMRFRLQTLASPVSCRHRSTAGPAVQRLLYFAGQADHCRDFKPGVICVAFGNLQLHSLPVMHEGRRGVEWRVSYK